MLIFQTNYLDKDALKAFKPEANLRENKMGCLHTQLLSALAWFPECKDLTVGVKSL